MMKKTFDWKCMCRRSKNETQSPVSPPADGFDVRVQRAGIGKAAGIHSAAHPSSDGGHPKHQYAFHPCHRRPQPDRHIHADSPRAGYPIASLFRDFYPGGLYP
jgi:hypothetical protein